MIAREIMYTPWCLCRATSYTSSPNAKFEDVAPLQVEDLRVEAGVGDFFLEIGARRLLSGVKNVNFDLNCDRITLTTHQEYIVVVGVDWDRQFGRNQLNQLDALFPVHSLRSDASAKPNRIRPFSRWTHDHEQRRMWSRNSGTTEVNEQQINVRESFGDFLQSS